LSGDIEEPVPHWDRRFPGRYQWEIKAFEKVGIRPVVDRVFLAAGRLDLTFDWPLDGRAIPLKAIYPDSYPFLRPLIFLTDPNAFPARHINPLDGNLCLIGRDTRQWMPGLTVRALLLEQLRDALNAGQNEDPQGEPDEVWWNHTGIPESYCLVDSSWSLGDADHGKLALRYSVQWENDLPIFRAAVTKVTDPTGTTVANWQGTLPAMLTGPKSHEQTVSWERVDRRMLPNRMEKDSYLQDLVRGSRFGEKTGEFPLGSKDSFKRAKLLAFTYQSEIEWKKPGTAWLFVFMYGSTKGFKPDSRKHVQLGVVRTYRAGPMDLAARAPAIATLRGKTITVVGLGALGAPLAIELARNGVAELRLLEFDVVEPGNSVRWPLGCSAWGRMKLDALTQFIQTEYPNTLLVPVPHQLGTFSNNDPAKGDEPALSQAVDGADLIIDATASYGVTTLVRQFSRSKALPLIALYASPTVGGGVVASYAPGGGCPVCLEWAWHDGSIEPPPGMFADAPTVQPPGCADRTFEGASFDLQEISLQAMRAALAALSNDARSRDSMVYTVRLVDAEGRRAPPCWRVDTLPHNRRCTCE